MYISIYWEKKKKKICHFFCFIAHLSGTKTELTNSSLCIHTVSEMVSVMSPLSIHTECKVNMALFFTQFTFWPTSREFCLALYRVSKYLNILILVCFKGLWVHFQSTSPQTPEINHICVHKINDTDVINSYFSVSEASSDSSSLLIDLLCPTILKGVIICYKQTLIIPAVNKFLMAMHDVLLTNSFTNNRKCSMHAMRAFSILLRLI